MPYTWSRLVSTRVYVDPVLRRYGPVTSSPRQRIMLATVRTCERRSSSSATSAASLVGLPG